MTDINLLESVEKNGSRNRKFVLGTSFVVPVVVLVAIFSLLIGAKSYFFYLEKKNTALISENAVEMENLKGKNVDRVVNFDRRMELGLKEISSKEDYDNYLKELESLMVSGARIDSFRYSSSAVDLAVSADNFNTVARQILSFKNSSYFKDLKMGATSRNEDGSVKFTMKK
jgi:hypothetical protein